MRNRHDLYAFLTLPWRIYRHDPNWVPPLLVEVKEFLNPRKHPFYRHGRATTFVAESAGQVVGRILVSDDPRFNAENKTNAGCFGMFESVHDQRVANRLLDAAANWSRHCGRTEIRGPIDYSMNYPCGLLVDGFDTPQRVMMNHNPPYYESLLTKWGLRKAKDLYAWWFDDCFGMVARWAGRAERFASRGQVRIGPFL